MPENPHPLLASLVGMRLASVQFVLNDSVRLAFEPDVLDGEGPVLDCFVWPRLEFARRSWREADLGYADAFRRLSPGKVLESVARPRGGIRVVLETGALVVDPSPEEVVTEIAMLSMGDGRWDIWRPGEESFEHLD